MRLAICRARGRIQATFVQGHRNAKHRAELQCLLHHQLVATHVSALEDVQQVIDPGQQQTGNAGRNQVLGKLRHQRQCAVEYQSPCAEGGGDLHAEIDDIPEVDIDQ